MVDALHLYRSVEEQGASHIPFGVENTVAVARLQFGCPGTAALMYLNLLLAVDESQNVVAGDGMAAVHELILVDVLVGDEDRFLAVELFRHGEVFRS